MDGALLIQTNFSNAVFGELQRNIIGHEAEVACVVASQHHHTCACSGLSEGGMLVKENMPHPRVFSGSADRTMGACGPARWRLASVLGVSEKPSLNKTTSYAASENCDLVVGRHPSQHEASICCIAISSNGHLIATADESGVIVIWDALHAVDLGFLKAHRKQVFSLWWCGGARGSFLVSSCEVGKVLVWDVEKMGLVLASSSLSPSSPSRKAVPMNIPKVAILELMGHKEAVWALAGTSNGRFILAGSSDKVIRQYDLNEVAFDSCTSPSGSPTLSSPGRPTSPQFSLRGIGARTGATPTLHPMFRKKPFQEHASEVRCIAIANDNLRIVSGDAKGTMLLWMLNTYIVQQRVDRAHQGAIQCVCWKPECSTDLKLQNKSKENGVKKDKSALRGKDDVNDTKKASLSRQTMAEIFVVSGGEDSAVRVWESSTGVLSNVFLGHTGAVRGVCCYVDDEESNGDGAGRRDPRTVVVSASNDKTIRMWSDERRSRIRDVNVCKERHTGGAVNSVFPALNYVASHTAHGNVIMWRTNGDAVYKISAREVESCCLAPNAKWLATALPHRLPGKAVIKIWDLSDVKFTEAGKLSGHTGSVTCMVATSDSRFLLSGSRDNTICVWDISVLGSNKQEAVCVFKQHAKPINVLDALLTPTSLIVVSADMNDKGNILHWRWDYNPPGADPVTVASLEGGHSKRVNCVRIIPPNPASSANLLSCNSSNAIAMTMSTCNPSASITVGGSESLVLPCPSDVLGSSVSSPLAAMMSASMLSCSMDGTIRKWDLSKNVFHRHFEIKLHTPGIPKTISVSPILMSPDLNGPQGSGGVASNPTSSPFPLTLAVTISDQTTGHVEIFTLDHGTSVYKLDRPFPVYDAKYCATVNKFAAFLVICGGGRSQPGVVEKWAVNPRTGKLLGPMLTMGSTTMSCFGAVLGRLTEGARVAGDGNNGLAQDNDDADELDSGDLSQAQLLAAGAVHL